MKQALQAASIRPGRNSQKQGGSGVAQNSMLKLAGSGRRQVNALERQAVELSNRMLRGQTGFSRLVTPTIAADYSNPRSPGRPMPKTARLEMESAFGADFSQVRIHTDNVSTTVAAAAEARAFTSGADIFFGANEFVPSTAEGRRLLAHELTHVLQQTGRMSSNRVLCATAHRSVGEIQCDQGQMPDFEVLRKLHGAANTRKTSEFKAVAQELAKRVSTADPAAALDEYFKASARQVKDWPAEAESLFYDLLKKYGNFERAAQLIARDDFAGGIRIQTAAWNGELVSTLEQSKGQAVYPAGAEKHPMIRWYVDEIVRLIETFVLQPDTVKIEIPELRKFGTPENASKAVTLRDHVTELSANLSDNTKLSSNEWVYNTLLVILGLESLRKSKCTEIRQQVNDHNKKGGQEESRFLRKLRYAEAVQDWGVKFLDSSKAVFDVQAGKVDPGAKTAWQPFFSKFGQRISKIGAGVVDLARRARILETNLGLAKSSSTDPKEKAAIAEAVKSLAGIQSIAEKTGVPTELVHALHVINEPGPGDQRPADTNVFRKRIAELADRWTQFSASKLEPPMLKHLNDANIEDELAYFFLTRWFSDRIRNFRWMAGGPESNPNAAPVDVRVYQRISFAQAVAHLTNTFQWSDVQDAVKVIVEAQLEKDSQLAILPFEDGKYWHYEPKEIEEFGKEIRGIDGFEPLTGEHLALLYRSSYYETLAQKISFLLPAGDKEEQRLVQSGTMANFVAARANEEVKKLPHPERWRVNHSQFAINKKSKKSFADLISAHFSFSEIRDRERASGLQSILPVEATGVFAWLIPPIGSLIPRLREIDLLNAQVAASLGDTEPMEKRLAQVKAFDDNAWLKKLSSHVASHLAANRMSKEQMTELQTVLNKSLTAERDRSWEQLLVQIKRASRLDRQLMAKNAAEHLARYADDHHLMDEPLKAIEPIIRFFAAISMLAQPDIDAEMTALMLELAQPLADTFARENRFDIIHSYLGFMELAMDSLPRLKAMDAKTDRHVFLPDYENTNGWIDTQAATLKQITEHFRAVREEVQKKGGYRASVTDKTLKVFMSFSSPIPVNTRLYPREGQSILGESTGTSYQVTKIYKDFIYHPMYGYAGEYQPAKSGKNQQKTARSGFSKAQILEPDDKTPLVLNAGEKLLEVRVYKGKDTKGEVKQVGAGDGEDVELLADIYNGLGWAAFGSSMENINAGIAWYVNTALDLAEFIPGVGQGITAGRVTLTIADFWANGGYDDIKGLISGELKAILEGLLQRIKDSADPEELIQLLLFGDQRLEELLAHSSLGTGREPETKGEDQSKIAKVIAGFRRIGRALFHALRTLENRVEKPMKDVQAFSTSRPFLSLALQFAADHIFELADLAGKGISFFESVANPEDRSKTSLADLKQELQDQQENFGERIHAILQHLEELKLPDTVLNLEPLLASVLGMLEKFVTGRLGLKAKAVFEMLKITGALDYFNARVAKEIVEAGLDPNIYWREEIVPQITDKFNSARDTVVEEINKVIRSKIFNGAFDKVAAPDKLALQPEGEPFEETGADYEEATPATGADTQPMPAPDGRLRLRPNRIPSFGAGRTLDPDTRHRAEDALGHDFRHVRLHLGAESGAMTAAFGADALATGSHIFLRPGLSPRDHRGSRVLHHELVHVLQQTGARPLGASASSQPIPGHPELGLDFNPERERVAEQAATQSTPHNHASGVFAGAGDTLGLQPAGLNLFTVAKLIRSFTDVATLRRDQEIIDKTIGKRQSNTKLPTGAATASVKKTLEVLKNLEKYTPSVVKFPDVFTNALPAISSRLANAEYAGPIERAAFEIAHEALPVPKNGAAPPKPADELIKPAHFAHRLEGYILAKTGIALGIKLNEIYVTAPSGTKVRTINDQDPVKQINILGIYLPLIDGRNPLWKDVIGNTWPGADDKKLKKIRIQVEALFEKKGIVTGIWALTGKAYKFSVFFQKEAEQMVKAATTAGKELDPKDLSSPDDYPETDIENKIPSQIGVRLATYGETARQGAGRHSHHLTQYLLADYFSNTHNKSQPFRKGRKYPGVSWTGDAVTLIGSIPAASAVSDAIQVSATKGDGRGLDMPTISLAASTHLSGRLHITPEADDLAGGTQKSQATAVHNVFNRLLPDELSSASSDGQYKSYLATHSDDEVAQTIYTAAQGTYKEVERRMSEALTARMPEMELEYYREMAEGGQYDLTDKSNPGAKSQREENLRNKLDKVPAAAKKYNNDVMSGKFGWKLNV